MMGMLDGKVVTSAAGGQAVANIDSVSRVQQ